MKNPITIFMVLITIMLGYSCDENIDSKKDKAPGATEINTDTIQSVTKTISQIESVQIGEQNWMTENLNSVVFRNDDSLFQVTTYEDWDRCIKDKIPAFCYYNFENDQYVYYNIYAVIDERNIAPKGFRVPTIEDLSELGVYLGGGDVAGKKLKSTKGWPQGSEGSDQFGFNGKPSGSLISGPNGQNRFDLQSKYLTLWTKSPGQSFVNSQNEVITSYYCYELSYQNDKLGANPIPPLSGFSLRCIKVDNH